MSGVVPIFTMPSSFIGVDVYMKDMRKIIKSPLGGIKISFNYQVYIRSTESLGCKEIINITCIIIDKKQAYPKKFCAVTNGGKDEHCSTWYNFPFIVQKKILLENN